MVRFVVGVQPRTSCRSLLKQLEILLILFQYLVSLKSFIVTNQEIFLTDSSLHNINTMTEHHLPHRPDASLSCFQKSTFFAGIKNFQTLIPIVTILKNDKAKFKAALRKYLHAHSFYSVDEFFNV
jgi:hypothetical protein